MTQVSTRSLLIGMQHSTSHRRQKGTTGFVIRLHQVQCFFSFCVTFSRVFATFAKRLDCVDRRRRDVPFARRRGRIVIWSNAKYFNRLLVGFRDIAKFWSILYLNSRMGMRQCMTGSQWIEIACCVFENFRQSVDGQGVKIFPRSRSID